MEIVKLKGTECTLGFSHYRNKTIAIQAFDVSDGLRFLTPTVNYEQMYQGENYREDCAFPAVVIKNYSENEGIYHQLIEQGVILPGPYLSGSGRNVQIGILTDKWQEIVREKLNIKL